MDDISNVKLVPLIDSAFVKPSRMLYTQNGVNKVWDLIKLHDSVAIIIFNSERKKLIFVKQFRPAVYCSSLALSSDSLHNEMENISKVTTSEGITLELCAGIIDKNVDVTKIAQSEVLEECGYDVPLNKFEKIISFRSGVGVSGDKQTLFYVDVNDSMKVSSGGGLASEGELIEVVEMSISEAEGMLAKPEVNCPAGFLFSLLWFMKHKASAYKTP